jgi:hypothetical protein
VARLSLERTPDQLGQQWVVERVGEEAVGFRVEQQAQWEQALAVRSGNQPPIDPDGVDLEEMDEGVRFYRSHDVPGTMDGRPATITQRLVKRLLQGYWENDIEVLEYYQRVLPPPGHGVPPAR